MQMFGYIRMLIFKYIGLKLQDFPILIEFLDFFILSKSYGKGSDILEIVREADEKMYENKAFIKAALK